MKLVFIAARTGCTCCSDENHHRGPYRTKEDAERRIAYYMSPDSKYWPLASQYAKRGCYGVVEYEAEELGNRIIIEDRVFSTPTFIDVNPDGTVSENDAELFTFDL